MASNAAAADYCPCYTAEALKWGQRKCIELPTTLRSHQLRSTDTLCQHRAGRCLKCFRSSLSFLLGTLQSSMLCHWHPDAEGHLLLISSRI